MAHFGDCKWGYLLFGQKETGAEKVAMATAVRVSFCFFFDAHLWVLARVGEYAELVGCLDQSLCDIPQGGNRDQ